MASTIAHILQYFPYEVIYDIGKSELYKIITNSSKPNLYLKIYKVARKSYHQGDRPKVNIPKGAEIVFKLP